MKTAVQPPLADRIKNGNTISENTESQGERQQTYRMSDIEMSSSESTWRRDAAEIRGQVLRGSKVHSVHHPMLRARHTMPMLLAWGVERTLR